MEESDIKRRQVNIRMPEDLYNKIKRHSERRGQQITHWIIEACRQRLGFEINNSEVQPPNIQKQIDKNRDSIQTLSEITDYLTYSVEKHDDRLDKLIYLVSVIRDRLEDQDIKDDALDEVDLLLREDQWSE